MSRKRRAKAGGGAPFDARAALGAALEHHRAGRAREAAALYQRVLEAEPDNADALSFYGVLAHQAGRNDVARRMLERAVAVRPGFVDAHVNLVRVLRADGRRGAAAEQCRAVAALVPDDPAPCVERGIVLHEDGDPEGAIAAYAEALRRDPGHAEAFRNIAIARLELGRHAAAKAAFHDVLRIEHGVAWWNAPGFAEAERRAPPPPDDRPMRASTFKLTDIVDQLEHLMAAGRLDPSFAEMAARYRAVRDEVEAAVGRDGVTELTGEQRARVGRFYDRVVHYADTPRIPEGAVNPDLDYAALEESYLSSPVAITTFDDFLTPAALAALHRFCLDSTIFFAYSGARFVGTDLPGGFNCAVLYQIAEELKARFPRVLGGHALTNIWAYRHRNETVGVEAHTDQGAVTFNFWITPDDANLEPGHGGLVVYAKEQPYDWDWRTYNRYKYSPRILEEINDFLATAETITVPYRNNRAVLFHSNLFHKSDRVRFKDGYRNRRINITMLFGKRGAGG